MRFVTEDGGRFPELDLLLLCMRWPQRREDREQISHLAAARLDWPLFLRLAAHHRVVPLVAHNLRYALPHGAAQPEQPAAAALRDLTRGARASALESLRSLAEMRALLQALKAAGVSTRVLKGLPVAQAVYGDIGLRSAGDIDLLISEEDLIAADGAITAAGYRSAPQLPRLSARRQSFYRAHWKDLTYRDNHRGFEVDLHWRCFRNPRMRGAELCAQPSSSLVSFGGFSVETLPKTEALLHLCVHGALEGWVYLKSLADVAAQVRGMTEAELDALADAASLSQVLPELTAALMMVRRYLAIDHWSGRLLSEDDTTVRLVLGYAERVLVGGRYRARREAIPTWATLRFELGLGRGWHYRREPLLRILFRPRMWQIMPLPDALFWLYPLLSPGEWLIFRMRGTAGRRRAGEETRPPTSNMD